MKAKDIKNPRIERNIIKNNTSDSDNAVTSTAAFPEQVESVAKKKNNFKLWAGLVAICLPILILNFWYVPFNAISSTNGNISSKENAFGKNALFDENFNRITGFKYDFVGNSSEEGLITVMLEDKWGFVDKNGKEIIPLKYDKAYSFSEGLAGIESNKKFGFINKNGKAIIPLKYDHANFFSEGLANVQLNGKCGFIDKSGNVIIPFNYDSAAFFKDDVVIVKLNDKSFYINQKGEYMKDFL